MHESATVMKTVDLVVLTARDQHLEVLLIRRGKNPHIGKLALPGGRVEPRSDRTLHHAAERELREETGINLLPSTLDIIGRYNAPGRDPRGDAESTAFLSILAEPAFVRAGDDAATAEWIPLHDTLTESLAFDHDQILTDGLALAERLGHTAFLRRQFQ